MAPVGDIEVPRARREDPEPSKQAANSMQSAAQLQREAIVALLERTPIPMHYRDIAAALGWRDAAAVDRRMAGVRLSSAHPDRPIGTRGKLTIRETGRSAAAYLHRKYLTAQELEDQTGEAQAAA